MRPARHLLQFAVIGALLFAAERRFATPPPLEVPAARIRERVAAFARETGAAPDARAYALLERDARDEELLAREARRLGLDRDDAVVRERLVSNMRSTRRSPAGGEPEPGDAAPDLLYREALALGMDASDALVRRRLAARMTDRMRAETAREPIDEATLRRWFEAHRDVFDQPAAVRFAQVCFSRTERAGDAERRAHAVLASFRDASIAPAGASGRGDPCLFGSATALRSAAELERSYGAAFAHAVFAADTDEWTGPVASSQGVHLVRVEERVAARGAEFELVSESVRSACIAERQDAALREGLAALRARHVGTVVR